MKIIVCDILDNTIINGKNVNAIEYWLALDDFYLMCPCDKQIVIDFIKSKYISDFDESKIIKPKKYDSEIALYFGNGYFNWNLKAKTQYCFLAHHSRTRICEFGSDVILLSEYETKNTSLYIKKILFDQMKYNEPEDAYYVSISTRNNLSDIFLLHDWFDKFTDKKAYIYCDFKNQMKDLFDIKKKYMNITWLTGLVDDLHSKFNHLIYLHTNVFDYSPRIILESRYFNKQISFIDLPKLSYTKEWDASHSNMTDPLEYFQFSTNELIEILQS